MIEIPVLHYPSLSSTMDKAKELISSTETPLNPPFVVMADRQEQGRGSYGKSWYSGDSGGLYYTLACSPKHLTVCNHAERLHYLVTLFCEQLKELTHLNCSVKAPNDLFLNKKKIGGILVESRTHPHDIHPEILLIGLGLNIDQPTFPEYLSEIATSLYIESGTKFDKETITTQLTATCLTSI